MTMRGYVYVTVITPSIESAPRRGTRGVSTVRSAETIYVKNNTILHKMSLVVVCTPTYNRRFSLEFSALCMKKQTYSNLHWIVLDNSSEAEKDWSGIQTISGLPPVTYIRIEEKKPIGYLRNVCLEEASKLNPAYIAFWDDDDYYPPQRIQKSVEALIANPASDIIGCEIMSVFLSVENALMDVGPYGQNHSTAATYLFRGHLAKERRFDEKAVRAEEGSFTKDWTLPMVMLPSKDILLVIGHRWNTVNKSQLLESPHKFAARVSNTANAKNVVRFQWIRDPEVWDCLCRTFLHS